MPPLPEEKYLKRYGIVNVRSAGPPNRLGFKYFTGKHLASGQRVFIKTDPSAGQAAAREAAILKILNAQPHSACFPRLVTHKPRGKDAFVATGFITGIPLDRFLDQQPQLTTGQTHRLLNQLTRILTILQMNKIIHRDIRPPNFMVQMKKEKPSLFLIDFSFAVALKPHSLPELPFLLANQWFLERLGGRYRAARDHWDDALSCHKLARRLAANYQTKYPQIWSTIHSAIGQLTFSASAPKTEQDAKRQTDP